MTSIPTTPFLCPKISLLFLFLSVSKRTVHRWLSLLLSALKTHLPKDFRCLSRNQPVDSAAPYFPVIQCSITSHWQSSSAKRTLLSVFSCPSQNGLCTWWSLSLEALTTKHPHSSLMYTKKSNNIWGCSTRFASYMRLHKFSLTSTPLTGFLCPKTCLSFPLLSLSKLAVQRWHFMPLQAIEPK